MHLIADARERTTATTNLVIALLCLRYVGELRGLRHADPWKARLWVACLSGLASAGALGAAAHGLDLTGRARIMLWRLIYLALGVVVALFVAGAVRDAWGEQAARRSLPGLLLGALCFFLASQRRSQGFLVFVVYEAVAMLFALAVYVRLAHGGLLPGAELMAASVLLSLLAAAIQASPLDLSILGIPFDHNGLFHLVQLAGLPVLAAGLRTALQES